MSTEDLPRQIILAKIGDHTITMYNFEKRLNDLSADYQKRLEDKKQKIKFLEQLVEVSLCSIEAARKSGAEEDGKNILDQAFKGTVKAVYRAKMAIGETLEERKRRFSELWDEALAEARK